MRVRFRYDFLLYVLKVSNLSKKGRCVLPRYRIVINALVIYTYNKTVDVELKIMLAAVPRKFLKLFSFHKKKIYKKDDGSRDILVAVIYLEGPSCWVALTYNTYTINSDEG